MTECEQSDNGEHTMWSMMRFAWPWGLLFPSINKCLYCGKKHE